MDYNQTTRFSKYLQHLIDTNQIDENKINHHFAKYNVYSWLHDISKPNDQRLLELRDLTHIDIQQLYWMRLKTEERQQVDNRASLKLVVQLMEYRYLSTYTAKYVAQQLKIQTQTLAKLMRLQQPINQTILTRFAQLYHVNVAELKALQVPIGNRLTTKPMPKNNNPKQLTAEQIRKWNHYQPVIQNLKRLIQSHPNLKTLSKIGTLCHIDRIEILYVDRSQTIKYAKLLASYLDMNLQALLTNGSEMGLNQVYHQARHYANKHKISLTKLENKVGIPYGFIRSCIKNSYLNALTRLATKLPTTVDDLVVAHPINLKDAIETSKTKDVQMTGTKPHAIRIKHANDTTSDSSSHAVQSLANQLNPKSQVATTNSFTDNQTPNSSAESVKVSNQNFESHVVNQILQNPKLQSLVSLAQSLEKQQPAPTVNAPSTEIPSKRPVETIDDEHWLKLIRQLTDKQKALLQNILLTWLTNH